MLLCKHFNSYSKLKFAYFIFNISQGSNLKSNVLHFKLKRNIIINCLLCLHKYVSHWKQSDYATSPHSPDAPDVTCPQNCECRVANSPDFAEDLPKISQNSNGLSLCCFTLQKSFQLAGGMDYGLEIMLVIYVIFCYIA